MEDVHVTQVNDTEFECNYCRGWTKARAGDYIFCGVPVGRFYVCSRPKGHEGPHVACGTLEDSHPLAVQEPEEAK